MRSQQAGYTAGMGSVCQCRCGAWSQGLLIQGAGADTELRAVSEANPAASPSPGLSPLGDQLLWGWGLGWTVLPS